MALLIWYSFLEVILLKAKRLYLQNLYLFNNALKSQKKIRPLRGIFTCAFRHTQVSSFKFQVPQVLLAGTAKPKGPRPIRGRIVRKEGKDPGIRAKAPTATADERSR